MVNVEVSVHVAGEDEVDVRELQDALERFAPEDPEPITTSDCKHQPAVTQAWAHTSKDVARSRARVMSRKA